MAVDSSNLESTLESSERNHLNDDNSEICEEEQDNLDLELDQTYLSQKSSPPLDPSPPRNVEGKSRKEELLAQLKAQQKEIRKSKFKRIGSNSSSLSSSSNANASTRDSSTTEQLKVKYVMGKGGKLKKMVKIKKNGSIESNKSSFKKLCTVVSVLARETKPTPKPEIENKPKQIGSVQLKGILRIPRANSHKRSKKSVKFAEEELTAQEIHDEEVAQERRESEKKLVQELELERDRVKQEILEQQQSLKINDVKGSDSGSDIFSDEGSDYDPFESLPEKEAGSKSGIESSINPPTKVDYFSGNIGTSNSSKEVKDNSSNLDNSFLKEAIQVAAESHKRAIAEKQQEESEILSNGLTPLGGDDGYDLNTYMDDDDSDGEDDAQPKKRRKK